MLNLKRFGILLCLAFVCFLATLAGHAQTYTIVHSFAGSPTDGAFANGELVQDAAGNFYGTTVEGGATNSGTVFKLDTSGTVTILHSFGTSDASGQPSGGLFLDAAGNLYGTTVAGGAGTVFKLDTENNLKTLHTFGLGTDGAQPRSRFVTIKGDLYGVTIAGGSGNCAGGCGTIFKITEGGTETVLYRFTGGVDGAFPQGLIRDSIGNLYGVASKGGGQVRCLNDNGCGTVWKLDTSGVLTVLYTFTGGADGGYPVGRLILDTADGSLRGATATGGDASCNCGVVFRVDSGGIEMVIHKFFGHGGGTEPAIGLLDIGGVVYGTTLIGGDPSCNSGGGCGLLYQVGRTGQYTALHRFAGATGDGAYNAIGGLTLGADGSIYGVTWYGGTGNGCSGPLPGCGVVFKYTP